MCEAVFVFTNAIEVHVCVSFRMGHRLIPAAREILEGDEESSMGRFQNLDG